MPRSIDLRSSLLLVLAPAVAACPQSPSGFAPPPGEVGSTPAAEPDKAESPPSPENSKTPPEPSDAMLSAPIASALARVPASIAAHYVLSLSDDRNALTIDPRPEPTRRDVRARGFSAKDSEAGGKVITLEGGPFRNGGWIDASFRERVSGAAQLRRLVEAGYDLDERRELLVVDGEVDRSPTLFAFSRDARKPGIVGVCSDVTILDFGQPSPPRPIAVRKPVIYLYPTTTTQVHVGLELRGELLAAYPALHDGAWSVTAAPDGRLVDEATGREHRYLFWEGSSTQWELDPASAHCVPGDEAASFLERVCESHALTADECGDMVTYWLPTLAQNPYTVIELVDEDVYGRYARLDVEPTPDTVIRPFMIFRRSEVPVEVGAPPLPRRHRGGFTVVEWGGADLDAPLPSPWRAELR
ncbi:hypothetical protein [Paraliomyxa miuraensis]|uniref:hypothetical protein n=1 Tax=Paraliomyxa miuraensis TaxID=376150 RepID=UPI00225243F7|nr:hypothetical protein [Paraliomyxa miuraensis]MCX4245768.1 hypothetical protein [Paraliomyxa miuraensis]